MHQGRVVDRVEARLDISFEHPLVGAGAEVLNLGDRVQRPSLRAEPIRTRLKVRLEDRLEHQLQGGLDHPVAHGWDTQPARPAAGLRDHPLAHGQRNEAAGPQVGAQIGKELLLAANVRDVSGGQAVNTRRSRSAISPHPFPCDPQEAGIGHEVKQIVEPTITTINSPTVQLRLDPQYPRPRLSDAWRRRAGIHRRPPGLPVLPLRTCCRPSPCTGLSPARTTTAAPPRPGAPGRRRACPPDPRAGRAGTVPTFTTESIDRVGAQLYPCGHPRVRRRPSSWPPGQAETPRPGVPTAVLPGARLCRFPAQIRQVRAGGCIEGP